MGYEEYFSIAQKYHIPIVVTGFEPTDILQGIYMCVRQLQEKTFHVENQYTRAVDQQGNLIAQKMLQEVFEISSRKWRGIGEIPESGFRLNTKYLDFDAERRFHLTNYSVEESTECISGLILRGIKKPYECPAFGKKCTPENPLGATMVSSEGACAAYFKYK